MESQIISNYHIFRTSLQNTKDVAAFSDILKNMKNILDWSVDLEDWEKVLRIECIEMTSDKIKEIFLRNGYYIEELPD